ncbi:MAG: gliding motility-associated C-terminal domain-containing protein [Bacteroidota bacterium]
MNLRLHHTALLKWLFGIFMLLPALPTFSQVTVEWDKTAGGIGWEELNTLIPTSDGGYLAGGLTTSAGPHPDTEVTQASRDTTVFPDFNGDFWLVKLDSLGNVQWDGRYGGYKQDRMWSAHETSDGGFILGGESFSGDDPGTEHTQFNRGDFDYWLVKIDKDGNYVKDWTYGGPGKDVLRTVIPVDDGFMLFGYSNSDNNLTTWGEKTDDSRGQEDIWIVKTDLNLTYVDDWTIGGSGTDLLNDAKLLPDGNFIISAWSTSPPTQPGDVGEKFTPNYGLNDYWILKIDPQANIIWQLGVGGDLEDVPNDLLVTPEGDILVSGFSSSVPSMENGIGNKTAPLHGLHDAFMVKITDQGGQGVIDWQTSYGGDNSDRGYSAVQTGVGNFMIVVHSESSDTSSGVGNKFSPNIGLKDIWVVYIDSVGNKLWDASVGGLNNDSANKIIKAHDNGFVFGGNSNSMRYEPYKSEDTRGGWNDMWIVKTGCFIEPPGLKNFTTSCNDDVIMVDATVDSCFQCEYLWSDGETDPLREFEPQVDVNLRLIIAHPDGCTAEDSIKIDVVPGIEGVMSLFSPVSCFEANDAAFEIEEVIGGSAPFSFILNEGDTLDYAIYAAMAPGEYFLEIIDSNLCNYDTAFVIEEPQEVFVELGDNLEIEFGDSVQLQALTNLLPGEFTFDWGQPDQLSCTDCLEPWVQPFFTTAYSIVLRDSNGCEKTDNLLVILDRETSVFIPNAFSPNNDNVNDFFTVYSDRSVARILQMQVYDKWGELLFENYNFQPNQDQIGWNGQHNGRFMQPGVFTFFVEVEYIDERTEIMVGDFTLIR